MRKKTKEVVVDDATLDEFERIVNELRNHAIKREQEDKDEMWFFSHHQRDGKVFGESL